MPDLEPSAKRWPSLIGRIRARTPARVLVDRAGAAYRTATQLDLRSAHAAARDAVRAEFDLNRDLGSDFVRQWNIFEVFSEARSKDEYLLHPDAGRRMSESGARTILARCPAEADVQVVIGDGLSVTAVAAQVPALIPAIAEQSQKQSWQLGQMFAVHYCRVGLMNHVGELLQPKVVVLLIGERPGLATSKSLSAYMGFQPRFGHTDACRNLISNIHDRGVSPEAAATRIVNLAKRMMAGGTSGSTLKEQIAATRNLTTDDADHSD